MRQHTQYTVCVCVCVCVCVYAHLACTPVPLYVSWLLSIGLYRSSLCDSGCVLVSVYLCLRASGHKQVCMCYAYAHASLVSDGPRPWLPVLRTLSSLFILSPQLSRQHQGFVCLLVLFYGFLFCLFVLVFVFVFTETLSYTLSTFLVLVCLCVSLCLYPSLFLPLSISITFLYLPLTPHSCPFISLHLSPFPGIIPVLTLCLCLLPPSLSVSIFSLCLSLPLSSLYFPLSVSIFLPCWSLALSLFLCVCLSGFFFTSSLLPLFVSSSLCKPLSFLCLFLPPLPATFLCLHLSPSAPLFLCHLCVSLTLLHSISVSITSPCHSSRLRSVCVCVCVCACLHTSSYQLVHRCVGAVRP